MFSTHQGVSRDELEKRRLAAAAELSRHVSQADVAKKYGVSRTTASRWDRRLRGKGMEAMKATKATGRPCLLTQENIDMIADLQRETPMTIRTLTSVIKETFGVDYDQDHVGRLMHKLGVPMAHRGRPRKEATKAAGATS